MFLNNSADYNSRSNMYLLDIRMKILSIYWSNLFIYDSYRIKDLTSFFIPILHFDFLINWCRSTFVYILKVSLCLLLFLKSLYRFIPFTTKSSKLPNHPFQSHQSSVAIHFKTESTNHKTNNI
jgi:hypothetical protein